MPLLSRAKLKLGRVLDSAAIYATANGLTLYLAGRHLLAGLLFKALLGLLCADLIASCDGF